MVSESIACLVSLSLVSGALGAPDYRAIVDEHLSPLIDAGLIPGAVVAIHHDGEDSIWTIGTMNYDDDTPMSADALFEIGSVSKVFTGVLLADSIARGEVTLDTTVDALLPDGIDAKDKDGTEVTLRHLTTHTAGWPSMPPNAVYSDPDDPFAGYSRERMFRVVENVAPKTTPGESFEYSNFGVGLLGTLVSDAGGGEYEALVKDRIFKPLGIGGITITLDEAQLERLAPATQEGRRTKHWTSMGTLDPAGMWVSDARSMLEFANANLRDDDDELDPVLMAAREPIGESPFGKVGMNWFQAQDGSSYWHNGMTGGYSSYMGMNQELGISIVVLTNGATLVTTAAGEKIFQEVAGMDVKPVDLPAVVKVDPDFAARLVGHYKSQFFELWITNENGRLFARITNQQALRLAQEADDPKTFRYEAVDAVLEFDLPAGGDAGAVTLFQNGMEIRCERVEE